MRICYPRGSQTRSYSPCGLQIHRDKWSTGTNVYIIVSVIVNYVSALSKKACRKLKMFSVKNEPRSSERSEGVWRVQENMLRFLAFLRSAGEFLLWFGFFFARAKKKWTRTPRRSQTRSYSPVDCKSTGTKERNVFCIIVFSPRGFAIPESLIADILSARVADPQLIPCGLQIHKDKRFTGKNGFNWLIRFITQVINLFHLDDKLFSPWWKAFVTHVINLNYWNIQK